jgi:hypothetical protein
MSRIDPQVPRLDIICMLLSEIAQSVNRKLAAQQTAPYQASRRGIQHEAWWRGGGLL